MNKILMSLTIGSHTITLDEFGTKDKCYFIYDNGEQIFSQVTRSWAVFTYANHVAVIIKNTLED